MSAIDRRTFLGTGAAACAATSLLTASAAETEPERVRVAVMGVNGRGRALIGAFLKFPWVDVTYICDPDKNTIPAAVKAVSDQRDAEPKVVEDFRRALDDKDVDVLVCAAPNHWHALSTVWACQAGKDVYVEKPASHNLIEGRRMVEAARKHKRVVQVGTQRRSAESMHAAVEKVRSGSLGDVNMARAWINSTRPNIGYDEVTPAPEHLDFDLWCGPGPNNGYKKNLVPYHWHWRWDYGNGECGNNGIHGLDIARWGMGMEAPTSITCGGGKYFFDDDQETPDTQLATFDFDGGCVQWEHRTWSRRGIEGSNFGIAFYGSEASLISDGRSWKVYRGNKELESHPATDGQHAHIENFLGCLVSREQPNADVEIGHRSTSLTHLANIAWRTRSTLEFDGESETFRNNDAANALLGRSYRPGFELPEIG